MALDFSNADAKLEQSVTAGTDFGESTLGTTGFWMQAWVYTGGSDEGPVFSFWDNTSGADYLWIEIDATANAAEAGMRTGATTLRATGSTSMSAGWHLITAHFYLVSVTEHIDVFQDAEATVNANLNLSNDLSGFNRISFGVLERSSGILSDFTGEAAGFAWGTGDPENAHDYAWNSGSPRAVTGFNFAGDAATLDGYWPADRTTSGTADGTETELDDTEAALDTWTASNTPQWSTRAAPWSSGGGSIPVIMHHRRMMDQI